MMRGITVKQPGSADQLQIVNLERPEPRADEILVRVKASAINRTDIINRESQISYLPSSVLGVEIAGVVEKVGEGVQMKVGTPVMGLVDGGGYAEYAVMPVDRAMVIPSSLSFEEAAAIPEVFLTAYQTLFWIGNIQPEETVLIHAGGSGVGTAAIQLAKQLGKANVITTAGSEKKLDICRKLGADVVVNYRKQQFESEVAMYTQKKGVNLILDFIGASYWEQNLSSIGLDGRWVLIGLLGGAEIKSINLMSLLAKRIQLTGTLLTPRSSKYKAALSKEFSEKVLSLFETGKLVPVVDRVVDFEEVQKAHEYMESNQNMGKIVLKID